LLLRGSRSRPFSLCRRSPFLTATTINLLWLLLRLSHLLLRLSHLLLRLSWLLLRLRLSHNSLRWGLSLFLNTTPACTLVLLWLLLRLSHYLLLWRCWSPFLATAAPTTSFIFNDRRLLLRLQRIRLRSRGSSVRSPGVTIPTLVSHFELLTLASIRHSLDTHRARQVTPECRRDWCNARDHSRVTQLPRDSRRNVLLASTPRRIDHRISQRRHQQWIEHRVHMGQHVPIGSSRVTPIVATEKVVDWNDSHRIWHSQIYPALIEISIAQVVRLPTRVVVTRHVHVARSKRHPADLVVLKRHERHEGR
jgi:hypothetical protein